MAYLHNEIPFPTGSRMTHVRTSQVPDLPGEKGVALGSLITLPRGQDQALEDDFVSSHLAFSSCGMSGVYPDGEPWLFVVQQASESPGSALGAAADPHLALRASLQRALAFNPGAAVSFEIVWDRDDLINIYDERGVDVPLLVDWPISALLRGLLAECCRAELDDIVRGYAEDCAFGGTDHPCHGDVFSDVFARWMSRLTS